MDESILNRDEQKLAKKCSGPAQKIQLRTVQKAKSAHCQPTKNECSYSPGVNLNSCDLIYRFAFAECDRGLQNDLEENNKKRPGFQRKPGLEKATNLNPAGLLGYINLQVGDVHFAVVVE